MKDPSARSSAARSVSHPLEAIQVCENRCGVRAVFLVSWLLRLYTPLTSALVITRATICHGCLPTGTAISMGQSASQCTWRGTTPTDS
ncbi:hypothetical protein E2C01_020298 [Portunus trituberculatus]|uniref:Uncharacterized protein n=1 Tax=Portunus trituberculatus TaxID=210409 RepID=A0A5B7E1W5_PORTR|nr:hypothetical protein [Portunus trituberculatus]